MNGFIRKIDVIRKLKTNKIDNICVNGVNIVDLINQIPTALDISNFCKELNEKFADAFTMQNAPVSSDDAMYYAGMAKAYCEIIEFIERNYKINTD